MIAVDAFPGHRLIGAEHVVGGRIAAQRDPGGSQPLDVLLERIPFTQTHRYVRKVLVHYQAYRSQHELSMPQLSVVLPEPRIDPLAF